MTETYHRIIPTFDQFVRLSLWTQPQRIICYELG